MNSTLRPDWVPLLGHRLHPTGVHFDAVRIQGVRGEAVAAQLDEATGGQAGPVICEATGFRWMYFLLAPGAAAGYAWPLGVQRFTARPRTVAYIGVPALEGNTWPLSWQSRPSHAARFVDAAALFDVLVHNAAARACELLAGAEPGATSGPGGAGPAGPRSPRP
ncbi:hypothetical protein LG634_36335 [Streptomyces bambusae]|uniref:hypothetical protein n=1 Tax=Streptomyces bambusae TaxID=1550616 RepID=UPI001CFF5969|nr:hypothetical protein [Streptomyces bambusae]MCB5170255.1 hypothetical protein [Streptomyces bambusae]